LWYETAARATTEGVQRLAQSLSKRLPFRLLARLVRSAVALGLLLFVRFVVPGVYMAFLWFKQHAQR